LNVCSRARDEPTSGLDEQTAARLLDDVLLNTGDQSLLYVTHRLDEPSGFDEVKVIEHGRVVGSCPPADDRQPVISAPASASDHALDSGEDAVSGGRVGT
jgi:ABC-type multidrug transport system ATPase subunit